MNVYGLLSINNSTFNLRRNFNFQYPKQIRNILVTILRIVNITLSITGYTEYFWISAPIRILFGILILTITLIFGTPEHKAGFIIGHWYNEAIITGFAHIFRGLIEYLFIYKNIFNLVCDFIATIFNFIYFSIYITDFQKFEQFDTFKFKPYPEPIYEGLFTLLYLV